jgi:hypothetical protein
VDPTHETHADAPKSGRESPFGPSKTHRFHRFLRLGRWPAQVCTATIPQEGQLKPPIRVMLFFTTFEFAIYLVKTATHYSLFRLVDVQVFLKIHNKGVLDRVAMGSQSSSDEYRCAITDRVRVRAIVELLS